MKPINVKYRILASLFLIFSSMFVFGQQYAERTLYRDSYIVNEKTRFEVENKYGSIHVKNWDIDSIQISTDVYFSTSSKNKLDKLKNGIRIKYSNNDDIIKAKTIFNSGYIPRSLAPTSEKAIEINYVIYLPENVSITINNQYGDVFIGSLNNNLKVVQSNGSFKGNTLECETDLNFSFVNVMLSNLKDAKISLNYSTININKAVSLNCEMTSSELYADIIGVLKMKSSRDKINIGKLDYIYGSANYTNFKVGELIDEIDGYFTYGQIRIDKMNKYASLIDIDSERTDIKLYIQKDIAYKYDILYSEDADLILPQKNFEPENEMHTEGVKMVKGAFGNDPTLDIRIRALKRCMVQILQIKN